MRVFTTIGQRKMSKFIDKLVRPRVVHPDLESAYAEMAGEEKREQEALEWAEITFEETSTQY